MIRKRSLIKNAVWSVSLLLPASAIHAQITTTTVQGVVYRADGKPATGTLIVTWPSFSTANNQAVAAGNTTVAIGQDGFVSLNLAPNAGSSPAGTYYTAIYHLNDGTVHNEYWVVPAAASASIVSIRAELAPATVAIQSATKQYVDASIASLSGSYLSLTGGTMSGPLVLSGTPVSGNQATTKQYTDQVIETAVPLTGGSMTGTLKTPNAVTKLPRVDIRHPDFAGGADPTGTSDSTEAIEAAIAFAIANPQAGGSGAIPCIYVPAGLYKVSNTLRIPSNMCIEGDSSQASILQLTSSQTNLFTVYAATCSANELCNGQISDLQLYGNGHATTGTLLEIDGAVQFHITNVSMANHGGRGLQLNNNSERFRSDNLSISSVRWPIVLSGDINESYFFNTQILTPGATAERYGEELYCYGINCPQHSYPYPNQGPGGSATPVSPDPHGAITITKAVNYSFYGGSIKSLKYMSGFRAGGYGSIKNFYIEGLPYSNEPRLNPGLYINGGVLEKTQLTGTLPSTALTVGVSDTSWMPQYFESASDMGIGSIVSYVIMPQDFLSGSTAPSQYNPNIQRGQFEVVRVQGFTSDGNMHILARNLVGSTVNADWPAGSIVEEAPPEQHNAIDLKDSHIEAIQGPGTGYTDNCNQLGALTCADIVMGPTPDGLIVDPTGGPLDVFDGLSSGKLTISNVDMFSNSYSHSGEIVAHRYSGLNFDGAYNNGSGQIETAETVGTSSRLQLSHLTGGSYLTVPTYANGNSAQPLVSAPGLGLTWSPSTGWFSRFEQQFGQFGGFNQWMVGTKFANSYCWFDTPSVGSTQSLNRVCLRGSPGSATRPGYEYDVWNGTKWVVAFDLTGQNNSAANLSLSGTAKIGGAFTAASVNGEITVDGTTYTTLNAAWSAAVSLATSTGHNQTVRVGPGTYPVAASLTEPSNGSCVNLVGSGGASTAADSPTSATTLNISSNINGAAISLGDAAQAQGCLFQDFTILANRNATHGLELQWFRGLLVNNVTVNDTSAEGILLGEQGSTTNGHQSSFLLRNITVSYSASMFMPANRPAYGIHIQQTAIDSHLDTVLVRNALIAGVFNEGTGNTGYMIHGFGYPYTCVTAPCSNTAASSAAPDASYATNYVIYDTGGAGSTWTDTYADSPAIAAFYVGANGTSIHGGHLQWPDFTSFPSANLAYISASVTNGLEIADIGCLGMSPSVNWITYASASGVPPTFASVHHLTGCGNYAQALEPETTTGFTGGGASNNAPGNAAVATLWASPKAATSNYEAYSAQLYNGYQTDLFEGHFAGQNPFFNITYQGTIRTQGGIALSTVVDDEPTLILTPANKNVIANASTGAQSITLPSCSAFWPDKSTPTGEEFTIVKSDSSANPVTVTTSSLQTINYQGATATTLTISSAGKRTLVCGPDASWYAY
ncbi:MAG TPA: glycosyl hydrolase family 28-related protein [Ktedonobacteraceae bacterium]